MTLPQFLSCLNDSEYRDLMDQVKLGMGAGHKWVVVTQCNVTDDYIVACVPTQLPEERFHDCRRWLAIGQYPLVDFVSFLLPNKGSA